MSIKEMTRVWELSEQKGSGLLCLLAIADSANDWGLAWPSLQRLARWTRLSARQVRRVVDALEASGELFVDRRDGRTHQYVVMVGLEEEERKTRIEKLSKRNAALEKRRKTPDKMSRVADDPGHSRVRTGVGHSYVQTTPDIAVSHDPSLNHHSKPSEEKIDPETLSLWRSAQDEFIRQYPREVYDRHFRHLRLVSTENGTLTVAAVDEQSREWLALRLDKSLRRTLKRLAGRDVEVKYEVTNGKQT